MDIRMSIKSSILVLLLNPLLSYSNEIKPKVNFGMHIYDRFVVNGIPTIYNSIGYGFIYQDYLGNSYKNIESEYLKFKWLKIKNKKVKIKNTEYKLMYFTDYRTGYIRTYYRNAPYEEDIEPTYCGKFVQRPIYIFDENDICIGYSFTNYGMITIAENLLEPEFKEIRSFKENSKYLSDELKIKNANKYMKFYEYDHGSFIERYGMSDNLFFVEEFYPKELENIISKISRDILRFNYENNKEYYNNPKAIRKCDDVDLDREEREKKVNKYIKELDDKVDDD